MKPQPLPLQRPPQRPGPARHGAARPAAAAWAMLAGLAGMVWPLPVQAQAQTQTQTQTQGAAAATATSAPPASPKAGSNPGAAAAAPKGKVVLTVQGTASAGRAAARKDFDMAALEAMPQHSFRTATPWFKEARTFSGPLLREVLAAAGVQGTELRAVALNNYKVSIPMADVQKWDMVLATRLDGKPMAVRDKGPLFIIYPFHAHEVLRSERFYSRSAWQLRTLEVK